MPDVPARVADLARRSRVLWVRPTGTPESRARLVWHVWHEGASWLVGGGREQSLPEPTGCWTVLVRDPDRRTGQVGTWEAAVEPVLPGTAQWQDAVPRLHAARLNATDGDAQPERWAAESVVVRAVPLPAE